MVNFDDEGVAGEGKGFYLEGNVIFDVENLARNYVPANSRLVMNGNFLPVAPPAGVEATGNVIGADLKLNLGLITNPATATAEQVVAALRPQWCSPVLGAGALGGNAVLMWRRRGFGYRPRRGMCGRRRLRLRLAWAGVSRRRGNLRGRMGSAVTSTGWMGVRRVRRLR